MGKRESCEWCGKSHYLDSARYDCELKNKPPDCTCPPYWRARGWGHSYAYNCPLAERSS